MTTSPDTPLVVPFLGARGYLQGPSMLEAIQGHRGIEPQFTFKVRSRFTTNRLDLCATPRDGVTPGAEYHWRNPTNSGCLLVYPGPALDPEQRAPFDETLITGPASIDGERISVDRQPPFGLPTVVVSLNKHLLHQIWPITQPGRWVFMALDMETTPDPAQTLSVVAEKRIASSLLARSSIHSGQRRIGTVDFIWR
ncbi:hypothetical protein [Magnetospirillum sp. 15-1]|uniref:hypothetical protein n=1 Tax=Magnetospirillum sp. 15-1 TaxID=1979370 RepID=UPI001142D236|nr:hypothetical protein [Magnetospirillum sp. 15-1]